MSDMEQDSMLNRSTIELQSEKPRRVIGEIPTSIVRWNIMVIFLIAMLLFVAIVYCPIPYERNKTVGQYIVNGIIEALR